MSMHYLSGHESLNPINMFKTIKYRKEFKKKNPTYFWADGLIIYCGGQGSGKTLSAVNYIYRLMEAFPKAKLVTNVMLKDYPIVTYNEWMESSGMTGQMLYQMNNRIFPFYNNDDFMKYSNGYEGVIYFVDEIHLYLNSLESKNVNMEVMTEIAQERKQRKHIVSTSQVFGRMAKPLREQFSDVIVCKSYFFKLLQVNKLINRDSMDGEESTGTNITGKVEKVFAWWHSPAMYGRYDTYYKIQKGKFVAGEEKKGDIYGRDNNSRLQASA